MVMDTLRGIFKRNGNGKSQLVEARPAWPPELASALTHMTQRLENSLVELGVRVSSDLAENDKRLSRLASDITGNLTNDMARFYTDVSKDMMTLAKKELTQGLDRITDRLEMLLQIPPPEPPDLEPVIGRLNEIVQKIDAIVKQPPQPAGTRPTSQASRLAPRAPGPVNLDLFNTLVMQDDELYELIPPEPDIYVMNIFNLGPGTVWVRNAATFIDDPQATMMPGQTGDNGIRIPRSLWVISEDGSTASIRLAY